VELRLVDDDGQDVADGEPGEIVCTGPDQFLGYLDTAHNSDAFDEAGWFRTGDIGVRDSDGYIAIVDRKKDIIIRAGENIASKEVEEILMRHPLIEEAAAVGVPDPTYGERVAAVVILRSGELALKDIQRFFRDAGVAIQKTPERLIIVGDFPRTPLGKINKRELRRHLASKPE
jgi:non-ribosomal peptide synthetase component E (peptide arylation enzyme)